MGRPGFILFSVLLVLLACFLTLLIAIPLPPLKPYSLVVEDRNGEFLHAFLAEDGVWRFRTSPGEIPPRLRRILLHKEDRYFYYHPGVNPIAIGRALVHNVLGGRKMLGASTITMQVARMLEPRERTYLSKCIEAFRAMQLEMRYSKDQILEMYLSIVPLGGNIEGLQSASYLYYQTPLERLNLAQMVDLTIIPNDPNGLRPDRNAPNLLRARLRLARKWLAEKYLSRTDSIVLWETPATATRTQLPQFARHFALRMREGHPRDAQVVSSIDKKFQLSVEKLVARNVREWSSRNVFNGGAIVLDNKTHQVLAYVGSEGFDDSSHSGQVDDVASLRSPGST